MLYIFFDIQALLTFIYMFFIIFISKDKIF